MSWFGLYRLGSECNDLTRLYAWAHPCTICATRLLDKEFDLAIGGLLLFRPSVGFFFFRGGIGGSPPPFLVSKMRFEDVIMLAKAREDFCMC